MTTHELGVNSSAAGWQAACPCGWQSGRWCRAKNSAMSDSRDHVRSESIRAGMAAREGMRK